LQERIRAEQSYIELQSGHDAALNLADTLEQEIRQIYLAWLVEAEERLAENDNSEEELLALLVLLMTQVRRRAELRAAELADEYRLDGAALAAMQRQLEETLRVFESNTINNIETAVTDALSNGLPLSEQTGLAAHVSMVGGGLWSAFQAGMLAVAVASSVQLEARWVGPTAGACLPCAEQVMAGYRPAAFVPVPGPAVCYGLTNCRHSLEFHNPVTGAVSWMPEGLV
jgi:hypothetical protein